jgi:hypothetical protein
VWSAHLVAGRTRSAWIDCGHARVWSQVCPAFPPLPLRLLTAAPVLDKMPKKKGRRRVEVSPAVMVLYAWAAGLQGAPTRFSSGCGARRPLGRPVGVVRVGRWRGRGGGAAVCRGSSRAGRGGVKGEMGVHGGALVR